MSFYQLPLEPLLGAVSRFSCLGAILLAPPSRSRRPFATSSLGVLGPSSPFRSALLIYRYA